MKKFLMLFICFMIIGKFVLNLENIFSAVTEYKIYINLLYDIFLCGGVIFLTVPHNNKNALCVSVKDTTVMNSRKRKVLAFGIILLWFSFLLIPRIILGFTVDNAWYILVPALFGAVKEELLFKGLFFKYLYQKKKMQYWVAACVVSVVFSLYHLDFSIKPLVSRTLWYTLSFVIYYNWRSLTLLSFFHYIHNLILYFCVPEF